MICKFCGHDNPAHESSSPRLDENLDLCVNCCPKCKTHGHCVNCEK